MLKIFVYLNLKKITENTFKKGKIGIYSDHWFLVREFNLNNGNEFRYFRLKLDFLELTGRIYGRKYLSASSYFFWETRFIKLNAP